MADGKLPSLILGWSLALLISALLVSAGQRWPEPLAVVPWRVWALVLIPPLLMGVWIASRWNRVAAAAVGRPGDGDEGQSCNSSNAQD